MKINNFFGNLDTAESIDFASMSENEIEKEVLTNTDKINQLKSFLIHVIELPDDGAL